MKPRRNEEGASPRSTPPATAFVYEIGVNQEMGIDCLGKYICNILTIFIHSFYWDIYYRGLRVTLPSAPTPTRPPLAVPPSAAAGRPGGRAALVVRAGGGGGAAPGRDVSARDHGGRFLVMCFSSC